MTNDSNQLHRKEMINTIHIYAFEDLSYYYRPPENLCSILFKTLNILDNKNDEMTW